MQADLVQRYGDGLGPALVTHDWLYEWQAAPRAQIDRCAERLRARRAEPPRAPLGTPA
jgi:hypothetical protein